jgi:hypothetical protein
MAEITPEQPHNPASPPIASQHPRPMNFRAVRIVGGVILVVAGLTLALVYAPSCCGGVPTVPAPVPYVYAPDGKALFAATPGLPGPECRVDSGIVCGTWSCGTSGQACQTVAGTCLDASSGLCSGDASMWCSGALGCCSELMFGGILCPGSNFCISALNDVGNCGGCGNKCAGGQLCLNGVCK